MQCQALSEACVKSICYFLRFPNLLKLVFFSSKPVAVFFLASKSIIFYLLVIMLLIRLNQLQYKIRKKNKLQLIVQLISVTFSLAILKIIFHKFFEKINKHVWFQWFAPNFLNLVSTVVSSINKDSIFFDALII